MRRGRRTKIDQMALRMPYAEWDAFAEDDQMDLTAAVLHLSAFVRTDSQSQALQIPARTIYGIITNGIAQ